MAQAGTRQLFETFPWALTELGPVSAWPAEMQAVVRTVLASGSPISTAWGPRSIQIYNDAYVPIYGDKHPHAFGRPIAETWPEIWTFLEPAVARVLSTGETLSFDSMLLPLARHGAPEECYFDFSYSPVTAADGRVLGLVSIAADKSAEAIALRRGRIERLMPGTDPHGALAALSAQLRTLLEENAMDAAAAAFRPEPGVPAEPGLAAWQVRLADREAPALLARADGAGDGGGRILEVLPIALDGLAVPEGCAARAVVLPVFALKGERLATLLLLPSPLVPADSHRAFAQRLSERLHTALHFAQAREAELGAMRQALAERETLYRILFENIADAAFYGATDGAPESDEIVLAANPQAGRMLGYDAAQLPGMSRNALFFPDDPTLAAALAVRARERLFVGELTCRGADDRPVPVELSSRLVTLANGETRSVTIMRNISERLARERARTDQVRFDTMARLTGGIAHDFNNLLTVILGSLDMLHADLPPGTRAHDLVSNALLASERAATLTGQLLQYARRQPLRAAPTDLVRFVREVRGLLASSLGEISTLSLELPDATPPCEVDQAQLTTALLNLMLNARHAMPAGGRVTVRVDATRIDGEQRHDGSHVLRAGDYVRICVSDDGQGIPDAVLPRVFEPFFTTRDAGQGTGLGLAMVQGFMRQSGGDVRISSRPGEGTLVELLFPCTAEPPPPAPVGSPPTEPLAAQERVLLVDDNELVRAQAARMLSDAGFAVVTAANGPQALEMLARDPRIDLLVTDMVMPGGLSGAQLAQEARRRRPGLPVLLVTGYDPRRDADSPEEFETLPKPFTARELAQAALRQLRRR